MPIVAGEPRVILQNPHAFPHPVGRGIEDAKQIGLIRRSGVPVREFKIHSERRVGMSFRLIQERLQPLRGEAVVLQSFQSGGSNGRQAHQQMLAAQFRVASLPTRLQLGGIQDLVQSLAQRDFGGLVFGACFGVRLGCQFFGQFLQREAVLMEDFRSARFFQYDRPQQMQRLDICRRGLSRQFPGEFQNAFHAGRVSRRSAGHC